MTKWCLAALLLACAPGLAAGQTAQAPDLDKAPRITQDEFKKLHDAGEVLVVDVRDAGSYKAGHIPGAISIPLDQLSSHIDELKASSKPIVTYCAWPAEHTSARAALDLQAKGIKNVRALKGGWHEWTSRGNKVEK